VRGLALDQEGNLYVVDRSKSKVLKFDSTGKFLLQWGGEGTGDGQFNMTGNAAGFVAVDSQGDVYVTENYHVQKFDSQGKFLLKWGTEGLGDGQFTRALAIAIDPQDHVYVVDIANNNVQKFDSNGKFLLKWSGKGSGQGQFFKPTSVAVDTIGNILVCDGTGQLLKFDNNGRFLSEIPLRAVEGKGIATVTLAVGREGQIYIGQYENGFVIEFDRSGKLLATFGETGMSGEGISESGGLALGQDGSVFVSDAFNNRVLKFRQH
jgi:tripartite motif-containing protein 71